MAVTKPAVRTPAQIVLFHTLESAGSSAVITLLVAAVQYLSTSGFNLPGLGTVLGTAFLAQMAMLYKSLMANPQTMQAVADTERQLLALFTQAQQTPPAGPIASVDVPSLAVQLKNELVKAGAQQTPAVQKPADITNAPTRPYQAVNTNTVQRGG